MVAAAMLVLHSEILITSYFLTDGLQFAYLDVPLY